MNPKSRKAFIASKVVVTEITKKVTKRYTYCFLSKLITPLLCGVEPPPFSSSDMRAKAVLKGYFDPVLYLETR